MFLLSASALVVKPALPSGLRWLRWTPLRRIGSGSVPEDGVESPHRTLAVGGLGTRTVLCDTYLGSELVDEPLTHWVIEGSRRLDTEPEFGASRTLVGVLTTGASRRIKSPLQLRIRNIESCHLLFVPWAGQLENVAVEPWVRGLSG